MAFQCLAGQNACYSKSGKREDNAGTGGIELT